MTTNKSRPAFTYEGYTDIISLLRENDYTITDYSSWQEVDSKCVILRHDIDNSIDKAVQLAEKEYELGVKSTYFVLLTSDFYNVHSVSSRMGLKRILELGHNIGLHFDEQAYTECTNNLGGGKE